MIRGVLFAAAAGFAAFQFIADENIFNQDRVGRATGEAAQRYAETISLVGTLQSKSGIYAFFDSPDADYRKALHEGGTIADFTVKRIAPDGVELMRGTERTTLKMGGQILWTEDGGWIVGKTQKQQSHR